MTRRAGDAEPGRARRFRASGANRADEGARLRSLDAVALESWTLSAIVALGTPPDIARDVTDVLLAADRRGIPSHGTARLPQYASLVEAHVLDPASRPIADTQFGATARFDARNGWGHHAGRVGVDWAIDAARTFGIALSTIHGSNHYGIAGWYALRAAREGLVGVSLTNSSPLVAPTRSARPLLGTNPIAVAAPRVSGPPLCLDMATSTVPRGRIEVAARRGQAIPIGWAIRDDGLPAVSPADALAGALLPLGGLEETGGYKGYGLALIVDVLTGVLAGAASGPDIIPLFSTRHGPSNLGQTFVVLNPTAIDPSDGFRARLEHLLDAMTSAPVPVAGERVLVPGEPESISEIRTAERGVPLDEQHWASLVELGARLGVPFPEDSEVGLE